MYCATFFTIALGLLASASPIVSDSPLVKRASPVSDDIGQKLSPQISRVNDALLAFPGSGSAGAYKIANELQNTAFLFDEIAETAREAGSFGRFDGLAIQAKYVALAPILAAIAADFGVKRPLFDSNAVQRILSGFHSIDTSATNYADAVISDAPFEQRPVLIGFKTVFVTGLNALIAEYS